jgi:hypothetical protein
MIRDRIETVQRIFMLLDTEATNPSQVARRLNEEGVPPVVGEKWDDAKVRALAKNPAYVGRPANNKKGGARFYEIVEGRIERVETSGPSRRRPPKDWVMPDRPIFPPIVDPGRFERVNEKLAPKEKRAPKSEVLYLSGLLSCGHCGRTMSGQVGNRRSKESGQILRQDFHYVCSTRRKYGRDNPTGCGFHSTQAKTIEPCIREFLARRGQTLDGLVGAERDHAAFEALLRQKAEVDSRARAFLEKAEASIDANESVLEEWTTGSGDYWDGSDPDIILGDRSLWDDDPDNLHMHGVVWLYEDIRGHRAGRIEGEIAALEREHEQLAEKIAMLTAPKLIAKLNAKAEELETRIADLKAQLEPMKGRWDGLMDELRGLRGRVANARQVMAQGSNRAKAQALRDTIERIECRYEQGRRARLRSVTIIPKVGGPHTFAVDRTRVLDNDAMATPTTATPSA